MRSARTRTGRSSIGSRRGTSVATTTAAATGGWWTAIAANGTGLPVMLGQPVLMIDRSGRRLRVETAGGAITADSVIVAVPSSLLAEDKPSFTPPLPEKMEAAAGLPLGLADKLFLSLADAEQFDKESRLFGRTNR